MQVQKIRVNVIVRVVKQSTGRGQLVQWPKKGTDVSGLREKEGHVTGHGGQCENSYKMGSETDEWIKKMRYIYTMEYYSPIKRTEIKLSKMRRQKNTQQMKEQAKNPPDQTNEEEILSLPEKDLRVMIVKLIQNLGNRMEKIQETFKKDLEELKSKQTVMNNTINEI